VELRASGETCRRIKPNKGHGQRGNSLGMAHARPPGTSDFWKLHRRASAFEQISVASSARSHTRCARVWCSALHESTRWPNETLGVTPWLMLNWVIHRFDWPMTRSLHEVLDGMCGSGQVGRRPYGTGHSFPVPVQRTTLGTGATKRPNRQSASVNCHIELSSGRSAR